MIENCLIDADIVCYRCAAATENEEVGIALWQTDEMMRRILHETNSVGYTAFLSGSGNFRYAIYPEYKANRKDVPKPKHYQAIREHLVVQWKAVVTEGIEADDAMAIAQTADPDNTIIASIDKDMLQVPGRHYNFVKLEHRHVSPLEGLRWFYTQLILGDKADNIFGYDGKARAKVPQFLQPKIDDLEEYQTEMEMFSLVRDMYNNDEQMLMNGQCLWLQRRENDLWAWPLDSKERMD